ncbi:MAG TPA: hypothetical protein VMW41_06315 [Candidatus Bathyarchaeia archaeon]|nr:hypothetical protein [Candidatus Bathyarchaeia archaeon]
MKKIILISISLIFVVGGTLAIAENILKKRAGEKPAEKQWITEIADDDGWVGIDSSIAVDTSGNPHISHFDAKNKDLKYAYLKDDVWVRERVDSAGHLGEESGIGVDSKGNVHISYNDITNGTLKYAKKAGGSWSIETVDKKSQSHVTITSLALDAEENPHIAYIMESTSQYGDAVKYASWDGSSWKIEEAAQGGSDLYLALDSSDNPHIAFLKGSQGNKKIYYTRKISGTWKTEVVDLSTVAEGDCGIDTDSKNYPHITYHDYSKAAIKYAKWDGISWQIQTVAVNVGKQEGLRLATDSQDNPHLVYVDVKKEKLVHAFFDQKSWTKEIISKMGIPSIAIDSLNRVHVSHGSVADKETIDPETGEEIEILKYSVRI